MTDTTFAATAPPAPGLAGSIIASSMLCYSPGSPRFRPGYVIPHHPQNTGCGWLGNAPLVPPDGEQGENSDDQPYFPKAFFRDLQDAGVDAVDHCYFDEYDAKHLLISAENARLAGTRVRVFPMLDQMPRRGDGFLVELLELPGYLDHPNIFRDQGRPVVSSFDVHGAETWRRRRLAAEAHGGHFVILGDCMVFFGPMPDDRFNQLRQELAPVDAIFAFLDSSPPASGLLADLKRLAESFQPRKLVGGCITPGYMGHVRQGICWDLRGTEHVRARWLDVIAQRPDFVHLTTTNDFSESTEQACTANSSFTFLDLTRYFGHRWRTGSWPAPGRTESFLSYRKTVADGEPVEVELVVLTPPGSPLAERRLQDIAAAVGFAQGGSEAARLDLGVATAQPGHLVWRAFLPPGLLQPGWAIPSVAVRTGDGEALLDVGHLAPLAIIAAGGEVMARWQHVPLHRVRSCDPGSIAIDASDQITFGRTITLNGIDSETLNAIACAVYMRNGFSLSPPLPASHVRRGFVESLYTGPGWCPMPYRDGTVKRFAIDAEDRYSAILRMRDGTIMFPRPGIIAPPRRPDVVPPADPSVIFDLQSWDGTCRDASWLERACEPADGPAAPVWSPDDGGGFRFDGERSRLSAGPILLSPGPISVECRFRIAELGRQMALFDSSEPILSLDILPDGRVRCVRYNQWRREVETTSALCVLPRRWTHLVATYDGRSMRLAIDGVPTGAIAAVHGVRLDKTSSIGGPAAWYEGPVRKGGMFRGDVALFRIRRRHLAMDEVCALHLAL